MPNQPEDVQIRERIKGWFSKIRESFKVTSNFDPRYNCFAYAIGNTEQWWEYDATNEFGPTHWPKFLKEGDTVESWIRALESEKFELTEIDARPDKGFEKVAIYSKGNGLRAEPTHAARQEASGVWQSKLGKYEDIEHETLDELCGDRINEYGVVVYVMRRKRKRVKRKHSKI